MKSNRVIIFIDGSNLYHNLVENFGKANINFSEFVNLLAGKNKIVKVYYYNAPVNQKEKPDQYKRQQKFYASLKKNPKIEIKLGRLEKRPNGPPAEKGVDVKIAVDIITFAYLNVYDTAILVSGDADFVPAIKAAQDFGKQVINVSFPKTKSFHLNQTCNKTILLDNEKISKILWKKK